MNAHTWCVKHMHIESLSNLESLKVKVFNKLIESFRAFDDLEKGKKAQSQQIKDTQSWKKVQLVVF